MDYILEIKHVTYQTGSQTILSDINWNIQTGAIITIVGPSGSGKSTLMRTIADLQPYSSGEIFFDGKSQTDYTPTDYRKLVSYAFQQPTLFGETVKDNLQFPYEVRNQPFDEQRALEVLNAVNLNESYLNRSIKGLSGGEKQRIALIRNIIIRPKVLILDEVTTGLDENNKTMVHQLVQKIHETGVTILQVTHDADEIKNSNEVIDIVNGQIGGPVVEQSVDG